ncbi:hypothetical protein A3K87_04435 [Variovorax paradoxus]|uniref:Uncharacterized protein n=1 Tax=Variovorax paradoxus TaxID=34073 RepID=A0AA91I887_VARPD|nr:hypothetical protein [Variovorax paradoxus]OAK55050.1 hypothetical protein A3K87_04435 [Variovorax paradoxus]
MEQQIFRVFSALLKSLAHNLWEKNMARMGKAAGWIFKVVSSFVLKQILAWVISLGLFSYLLAQLSAVPIAIRVTVAVVGFCVALWVLWRFVLTRPVEPKIVPLYWDALFKHPLKRTSWDFDRYIAYSISAKDPATVHGFQARFRFNWRPGCLEEAFITSVQTGQRIDLKFRATGFGVVGPSEPVALSQIKSFQGWMWVLAIGAMEPISESDFLGDFGHFRLTYKIKGRLAKHVDFTLADNTDYFKRARAEMLALEKPGGIVLN